MRGSNAIPRRGLPSLLVGVLLSNAAALPGCNKPDSGTIRKGIAEDMTLSDAQALERLARSIFKRIDACRTVVDSEGRVAVELVVRVKEEPSITILQGGGADAARVDSSHGLGMLCFGCKHLIEDGSARNLGRITLTLRDPVFVEERAETWFDVYKFSLTKDRFKEFLGKAKGTAVVRNPRGVIEETCNVEFDRFGDIRYVPQER